MKVATTGVIEETTVRKRTIPEPQVSEPTSMPDFWDYLEALTAEAWDQHVLYIYRVEPKISNTFNEPAYLEKCNGVIEVRPGTQIRLTDRGVVEETIKEKHGGRLFLLILKRGHQRITITRIINECQPKFQTISGVQQQAAVSTDQNAAAQIGSKAIDALSGVETRGFQIAMNALESAAKVLNDRQTQLPAPVTNPLLDKLLEVSIARMLNPEDPLERMLKYKELFAPAASASNPLVDKILATALDRLLQPPPAPAGDRTNLSIELARQIPTVSSAVKDSVHEWRLGMEAQERATVVARGGTPAGRPEPIPIPVRPISVQAEPQKPASNPVANARPTVDEVEKKIVEILQRNMPVNETADEVLAYLVFAFPELIGEMLTAGDKMVAHGMIKPSEHTTAEGILHLFQTRPILQQVQVNQRLVEFIKVFIEYAKKYQAETPAS